jgi:diguanylate cyclase (GGDEF)-like protein
MTIVIVDIYRNYSMKNHQSDKFFYQIIGAFFLFLIISIYAHAIGEGYLKISSSLAPYLWGIHFNSIPIFLICWVYFTAINTLSNRHRALTITAVSSLPYVIFLYYQIIQFSNIKIFEIDADYHLIQNLHFLVLVIISSLLCVVMLVMVFQHRNKLKNEKFVIFLTTPLVLLLSLVLFYISGNHPLFTLSSAFLLLFNHLFKQRELLEKDGNTSLPNGVAFEAEVQRSLSKKHKKIVFVLDIENFRAINHRYGLNFGDLVLKYLSEYLQTVDEVSSTFKLSSDRFGLIAEGDSYNTVTHIVKQINRRCTEKLVIENREILIQVNTAIVMIPSHAKTSQEFVDSIDFTMALLKSNRKLSAIIYNKKLFLSMQRKQEVISAIHDAIYDHSHLIVNFQPIYDVKLNKLCAAEALTRIDDPTLGLIMPGEFIPLAENEGLITQITEIVLHKTCQFIQAHNQLFTTLRYISINLSVEDISVPQIDTKLFNIIDSYNVEPSLIAFELTESMLLEATKASKNVLESFAKRKVTLVLDDFGVGYSNLNILARMPFDIIKLDQSLLRNSEENFDSIAIISDMLHRFKKRIVIEGVETEKHLTYTKLAKIEMVQGYLFSKPISETAFLEKLNMSSEQDEVEFVETDQLKKNKKHLSGNMVHIAIVDQ